MNPLNKYNDWQFSGEARLILGRGRRFYSSYAHFLTKFLNFVKSRAQVCALEVSNNSLSWYHGQQTRVLISFLFCIWC